MFFFGICFSSLWMPLSMNCHLNAHHINFVLLIVSVLGFSSVFISFFHWIFAIVWFYSGGCLCSIWSVASCHKSSRISIDFFTTFFFKWNSSALTLFYFQNSFIIFPIDFRFDIIFKSCLEFEEWFNINFLWCWLPTYGKWITKKTKVKIMLLLSLSGCENEPDNFFLFFFRKINFKLKI